MRGEDFTFISLLQFSQCSREQWNWEAERWLPQILGQGPSIRHLYLLLHIFPGSRSQPCIWTMAFFLKINSPSSEASGCEEGSGSTWVISPQPSLTLLVPALLFPPSFVKRHDQYLSLTQKGVWYMAFQLLNSKEEKWNYSRQAARSSKLPNMKEINATGISPIPISPPLYLPVYFTAVIPGYNFKICLPCSTVSL